MTVFVLSSGEKYGKSYYVHGVYSTQEKAIEEARKMVREDLEEREGSATTDEMTAEYPKELQLEIEVYGLGDELTWFFKIHQFEVD